MISATFPTTSASIRASQPRVSGLMPGLLLSIVTFLPTALRADEAAAFFTGTSVHEIRLTFADAGWYDVLYKSHAEDPTDPYFPASFTSDGVTIAKIGVRFKGNSSFADSGIKKSFKLDFNTYEEDANFAGMVKLNLNNGFMDPSMLREKLFFDFAGRFMPAPRVTFVRLVINGSYYGLYSAVEQVDGTFVRSRFGDDESGNLFKAEWGQDPENSGDQGPNLAYLGDDPAAYEKYYQLKTNEADDDYAQLITLTRVLDTSAPNTLSKRLAPLLDVREALYALALNNIFVNLDSYNGSGHNYYIYDRSDTGAFTYLPWDAGLSFGRFLFTVAPGDDPLALDPFALPTLPHQSAAASRPLMERPWAISSYRNDYLCAIKELLASGFDASAFARRVTQLAKVIRPYVKADPNKMYSNDQFEQSLTTDTVDERGATIYGLVSFIERRAAFLNARIEALAPSCSDAATGLVGVLHLNEVMADNVSVFEDPDDPGDFPDWIEVYNSGSGAVNLKGAYLTDDPVAPTKQRIGASVVVPPKGFVVLLADGDADQGRRHLGLKLDAEGDDVAIVAPDGHTLIDSTSFGQQGPDTSRGRSPDGSGSWHLLATPSPGASNAPYRTSPPIFVAVNHSPAHPPAGQPVVISATIASDRALKRVSLRYRTNGATFIQLAMSSKKEGEWSASVPGAKLGTTVEYYIEAIDAGGLSSTNPSGAPTTLHSYTVGSSPPTLKINELMAENDSTIQDPDATGWPDWIEIYNPGVVAVDLSGMHLTDDSSDLTRYRIPDGVQVAPHGFLLFWADNDPDQGSTHASFKLSVSGEKVSLVDTDGTTVIDSVAYPALTADVSYGRTKDGATAWKKFATATPGKSNTGQSSSESAFGSDLQ